jgi:hypothetical protein
MTLLVGFFVPIKSLHKLHIDGSPGLGRPCWPLRNFIPNNLIVRIVEPFIRVYSFIYLSLI